MKKLKINKLNKERFTDNIISSLHKITGGYWVPSGGDCNSNCGCACANAGQGGSSIADNVHANEADNWHPSNNL